MKDMSLQEHTTALFIIALYYWLNEDEYHAESVLHVALHVSRSPTAYSA